LVSRSPIRISDLVGQLLLVGLVLRAMYLLQKKSGSRVGMGLYKK
jgi:hypothetical protein